MIVLVVGPDAAAARAEVARVVAAHDPDGLNTTRLDGREASVAEIALAAGSLGFFGARRVVVVQGLMARASRGRGGGEEDGAETATKGAIDLAPLLRSVPEQNVLILVDPDLGSLPAAVKKAAPDAATVVACEPPRGRALLEWLQRVARAAGGEIDADAARFLADSLYPQTWSAKPTNPRYDRPPDTDLLRNEVEKLVLAAHPDPVQRRHVEAMTAGLPDDRIFRFLEAAGAGGRRLPEALAELDRLHQAGEEPAKLGAQLAQQAELAVVLEAAGGRDPVAVGRDLGLSNPNRMSGLAGGRRGTAAPARVALTASLAADRDLKQGRLRRPADALYAQVLGIARPGHGEGGT